MPDRPAAELLAEWLKAKQTSEAWQPERLPEAWERFERTLERLARAERALAIAKTEALQLELVVADQAETIAVLWARAQSLVVENPYRAALRASQGGQT